MLRWYLAGLLCIVWCSAAAKGFLFPTTLEARLNKAAVALRDSLPIGQHALEQKASVFIVPPSHSYYEDGSTHCSGNATSSFCSTCDVKCDPEPLRKLPREIVYPIPDAIDGTAGELIDRVLREAWGRTPPSVDLYVRAGCAGLEELLYLIPTIELFWPRFLGKIIIVLDYADHKFASRFGPVNPTHAYEIHFEHTPCMPGRVFNQVSHLHMDLHSDAEYFVAIDSDCVFITPVTPDLLFSAGKLLIPHSEIFQRGAWNVDVEYFVGRHTYGSHPMVVQPLAFHRSTFEAYRNWYRESTHECYTDAVSRYLQDFSNVQQFCWMCQLWTFMNHTGLSMEFYQPIDIDSDKSPPFQRYAIHLTYEKHGRRESYGQNSLSIVLQGLCNAFGEAIIPDCAGIDYAYFDRYSYSYANHLFKTSRGAAREHARKYQMTVREIHREINT